MEAVTPEEIKGEVEENELVTEHIVEVVAEEEVAHASDGIIEKSGLVPDENVKDEHVQQLGVDVIAVMGGAVTLM